MSKTIFTKKPPEPEKEQISFLFGKLPVQPEKHQPFSFVEKEQPQGKFSFVVEGQPQGKARPRFTKIGKTYTPAKTKNYEARIKTAARKAINDVDFQAATNKPVSVVIEAVFPIPKSHSKTKRALCVSGKVLPTVKPDVDNITKIVCDALNGIAYQDDKQVIHCVTMKRYTKENEAAALRVVVETHEPTI